MFLKTAIAIQKKHFSGVIAVINISQSNITLPPFICTLIVFEPSGKAFYSQNLKSLLHTNMDQTTKKHIDLLHPSVREEVTKIIEECNLALTGRAKVRITQGLRTFQEQEDLYAFGRTKPGKKVTNAKGGQSIHNYGFAVDICLIIDGKVASWDTAKDWDNDQISDWQECVKIFAKYNWNWGGDWKTFKDLPHFDKKGYSDWKVLSKLKRDKKNYVILYK